MRILDSPIFDPPPPPLHSKICPSSLFSPPFFTLVLWKEPVIPHVPIFFPQAFRSVYAIVLFVLSSFFFFKRFSLRRGLNDSFSSFSAGTSWGQACFLTAPLLFLPFLLLIPLGDLPQVIFFDFFLPITTQYSRGFPGFPSVLIFPPGLN